MAKTMTVTLKLGPLATSVVQQIANAQKKQYPGRDDWPTVQSVVEDAFSNGLRILERAEIVRPVAKDKRGDYIDHRWWSNKRLDAGLDDAGTMDDTIDP